jgi:hypothetical protein
MVPTIIAFLPSNLSRRRLTQGCAAWAHHAAYAGDFNWRKPKNSGVRKRFVAQANASTPSALLMQAYRRLNKSLISLVN